MTNGILYVWIPFLGSPVLLHLAPGGGGGVGIPIYGLDRYVPPDRVWFLRVSILQYGIIFAHFGIVFPVCSLDRVSKFWQLKFKCVNFQLQDK